MGGRSSVGLAVAGLGASAGSRQGVDGDDRAVSDRLQPVLRGEQGSGGVPGGDPTQIRRSVEQLGFHWKDIKILLIGHAHFDHAAGSARIVRETGARYMVMDGDVPVVETGGARDFAFANGTRYPPVKVDRVLHDGDEVRLGGTVLVAHRTAGHTRGCTTWTMRVIAPATPGFARAAGTRMW